MGTISNKLQRVLDTKEDIRQALIEEGKDVPTDMPFRLYPEVIKNNKLPGLVGMYMGKGYTNESMSKNPVWYDTSGNGNHIQLKNFGWKLDSGCGKYDYDFSEWSVNTSITVLARNSDKVTFKTILPSGSGGISKRIANKYQIFKINITDLAGRLEYRYWDNVSWTTVRLLNNGYHELDFFELPESALSIGFILIGGGSVTIEQIPDYDGAICFDGVNDYGICETFPVLTKEKGYTVMALRKWISRDKSMFGLVSNVITWSTDGAFILEYKTGEYNYASSFGGITNINSIISNNSLVYQTSTEYNGLTIKTSDRTGSNTLVLGKLAKLFEYYANYALYALAIFDHDTTAEECQPVIDYWKKEFPELFPDQAWTVTGKSNSDADRATIKNITGNGNDLVLTNFGYAENSGYGLYELNFSPWIKSPGVVVTPNKITFPAGFVTGSLPIYNKEYNKSSLQLTINVSGLIDDNLIFKRRVVKVPDGPEERYITLKNGINKISVDDISVNNWVIAFGFSELGVTLESDITIEQIPDYEGYLLTDGVDDQIIASQKFELSKDYTIVGDWKFLVNESMACGISRIRQFYVYNHALGVQLFINSTGSGVVLGGIKSLKAICSNGKVYDENWNEIVVNTGDIVTSADVFVIGYSGARHTQTAFKNLGIYNNAILNKEQCIRAYNYLQTIKNV